jgi:signal transduction histidine kinase
VFRVIGCIANAHDLRLVLLAAVICLLSVGVTFYLYATLPKSPAKVRAAWLAVTGLVAGSGIWAVHFVAMLAFEPGLRSGYAPFITLISLAIAIAFAVMAFTAAAPDRTGKGQVLAGGALLGIGIALMHFTGMAALRVQGLLHWDIPYVVASVLVGIAFATAALRVGGPGRGLRAQIAAAGLLTLGICGLHFTAMSAVAIEPIPAAALPPEVISRPVLALAVTVLTVLIIAIAAGALVADLYMRRRAFDQLREAIDAMADGMSISDAEDRLVAWNARYVEQIGGGAITPAVGMRYADLLAAIAGHNLGLDDDQRAAWVNDRMTARREQGPDLEVQMFDGHWLRVHNRPTRGGGVVTSCVDITDLKLNALVLAQALSEADAASRAKTEFLANITHEIRTPLNGVLGMSQIIGLGDLSPIQRQRLSVLQASGEDLLTILNDVLDVARMETGKLEIEAGRFDAAELGAEVEATFAAANAKAGLALNVAVAPGAAGPRSGDPARVSQILRILVSNAMKFTAAGGVQVTIDAFDEPQAAELGEGLRLTVRDTGVGIAQEALPHLFGTFTQADSSNTRRYGGAGLGLSIARSLIDLMGGDILVESALGEGSTFTVLLPAARVDAARQDSSKAA